MSYLTWEKNREKWEKEKGDRDETNQSINAKDDAKDEAKVQLVNSNIKDTYEFISTMPLISLRQEPINISIPWISETELEKAILQWEAIKQSRSLK
ncbi:MAG: hypothetical protein LBU14_03235 [Candidatus Peribacteria bacterium]|jgi:hypothetical protein|nr:hypothetical protein [Candidatus Peribacteria bacterium]